MVDTLSHYGPLAIIVGFFIWWSWLREQRMSQRIVDLSDYLEKQLVDIIKEVTKTVEANTHAMTDINKTMDDLRDYMENLKSENGTLTELLVSTMKPQQDETKI
jgi:hypothetical protein